MKKTVDLALDLLKNPSILTFALIIHLIPVAIASVFLYLMVSNITKKLDTIDLSIRESNVQIKEVVLSLERLEVKDSGRFEAFSQLQQRDNRRSTTR